MPARDVDLGMFDGVADPVRGILAAWGLVAEGDRLLAHVVPVDELQLEDELLRSPAELPLVEPLRGGHALADPVAD